MIINHIYDWASRQPDKPAIIHNDQPIGYVEFAHAIDAARRYLAGHDLPVGKTAVVLAADAIVQWATILALRSLGMNTICVGSLAQVEILAVADIGAVVTTPGDIARRGITRPKAFGRRIIVIPDRVWLLPQAAAPAPLDDPARPYGGHILYTSGTTGEYKKVLAEGRHEDAQVLRCVRHRRIEPGSVVHMLSFGIWTGVGFKQPLSVWRAGATLVIDQTVDVLPNFFRYAPSLVSITPGQVPDLIARTATVRRPAKMPIVNLVGGFVSPQLLGMLRNAGFDDIMNNYGSTECSHILRSYVDDGDQLAWLAPAADRQVEIVDEDGRACAVGQQGALRVALFDHDAHGYLDDPAATASMFRDGWFYPGDLAVARDDGRIRILGRAGDVLNVRGEKLAAAPLEQDIRELLEVENVCLFQGIDDDGVEELVVVVEADEPPAQPLIDRIASGIRIGDRIRVEIVKPFPRTTAGMQKIKRLELRKMVFGTTTTSAQ